MVIWIDIGHPAQLNFYKNAIKTLSIDNSLLITIIDRGKLVKIAKKEIGSVPNCKIFVIAQHRGTKFSSIIDANFLKFFKLINFYFKNKPDIAVGNSFLHGMIAKLFRIPSIMFGDDIGRKAVIFLMRTFSDEMHYVKGSLDKRNYKGIETYNALKEWSYLSPKYFKPNTDILKTFNVNKKDYIFVREVITGTMNYHSQQENTIAIMANQFPSNYKVILSLEDKSKLDYYPKDWILLEEPIDDIYSLIYYSSCLLSSGDSMAREGAMLGVPSIYCGIREMNANKVMIKEGMLFHKNIKDVPLFINNIVENNLLNDNEVFREKLNNEWIDVCEFIVNRINNYKN